MKLRRLNTQLIQDTAIFIILADAKFPNQSTDAIPPSPSRLRTEYSHQIQVSQTTAATTRILQRTAVVCQTMNVLGTKWDNKTRRSDASR